MWSFPFYCLKGCVCVEMRFLCTGWMSQSWNIRKHNGVKLKSVLREAVICFGFFSKLTVSGLWLYLCMFCLLLLLVTHVRKMPCTLPSELLPFLIGNGLFPEVPLRKRMRYWNHLRGCSSPMAMGIPSNDCLPLFIWGDAAQYCKDESVIIICIGCTLDDRKDSIQTHFPLVICREDPWPFLVQF